MSHGGWDDVRHKRVCSCHPERRHYAKGLCRACYRLQPPFLAMRAAYYEANKPLWLAQYARTKTGRRKLVNAYGISAAALDAMLEAQGHVCAICYSAPKRKHLALDHCHSTGKVRAFLCHPCNGGLGLFRDDPVILSRAIAYLEEHRNRD
jgi:Recombination endonuclease VII